MGICNHAVAKIAANQFSIHSLIQAAIAVGDKEYIFPGMGWNNSFCYIWISRAGPFPRGQLGGYISGCGDDYKFGTKQGQLPRQFREFSLITIQQSYWDTVDCMHRKGCYLFMMVMPDAPDLLLIRAP